MQDLNRAVEITPEIQEAIDDAFQYHPWKPDQVKAGEAVREAAKQLYRTVIQFVPSGPDRTVALRKIREARMDANSAITHGGRY